MNVTRGQANIWRVHVRQALREALYARRPFSEFKREAEERNRAMGQVLRAMFIAKIEGDEFSRYPRR